VTAEAKKIPEYKRTEVESLKELINKYDIICLANMHKLGARQLQFIRKKLADKIVIRMTKNRLFKIAAQKCGKKNIEKFLDEIKGSSSFIFTDMNPFKLQFFLGENRVVAPAKAGDIAPRDIIVPEGGTGFPPGPMISEFKKVGIDSMVKKGSIYIKEDTVVAKKGEEINRMLALVLSRLDINPMLIGLNLYAAYDNGLILQESHLDVDLEKTIASFRVAIANAMALSIQVAYPTKENIRVLLQKAFINAKSLSTAAGVITKDTLPDLLSKAYYTMLGLSDRILQVNPDALPSDIKQKVAVKEVKKTKQTEPKKKDDKKKEEKEEESEDLGLGSLFG
jgi:large subunit ribosomal protein L10